MSRSGPLLSIRLEGKCIGEGRIGTSHLITLLTQLNKAFLRSSQVLQGNIDSMRRGPKEKNLKELLALELVSLTHGKKNNLPDPILFKSKNDNSQHRG